MSRDSGSSLAMFVMGIVVGGVIAALCTPLTGSALRRRLSRGAEAGAEMADDALEHADEFVQKKSKATRKFANSVGAAFEKARSEAANATE